MLLDNPKSTMQNCRPFDPLLIGGTTW
jgi:hypothetical protein